MNKYMQRQTDGYENLIRKEKQESVKKYRFVRSIDELISLDIDMRINF